MRDQWTIERLHHLRDAPVYDAAGDKIGKVDEIFYDTTTGLPEWIGLGTGFFGSKRVLVPVAGAQARENGVVVPHAKDRVNDAPDVDGDEISPALESELHRYYAGRPAAGQASVTRKEEELAVGKRPVEAGRVRLHKWVETEPVSADVELTRERAHVERERIDEPVSGHEFREESVEIPLTAEEPVVEKRAVAKECVSVGKHAERDTHTVTGTVRKERVDVERDGVENVDEID